uniref:50S ribosomal protein L9, chloroplastic n=1 Tax=Plocamium cartilagineum TaxID=31452 RepID=A0A1C9CHX6_PLOCA|nr:ribosomal protein L9 [Plocamium cartilagineum]AOM67990.1 ribosomal protein L9 [Plocamium cartilagineum]
MKKKIKLILNHTINNLGLRGNIVQVKPGYAFNYLIPNNIAKIATEKSIQHTQLFEEINKRKIQENQIKAKETHNKLEILKKISIKKKIGKNSNFFGSINEKEISIEILKYTGYKLDKKQIKIPEIKKIGIYIIEIQIIQNYIINMKLQILPENI